MSVPKRFGILRFISRFLKVIAWIVLFLSIIVAIGMAVPSVAGTFAPMLSNLSFGDTAGGVASAIILINGIFVFFALYAYGESLHLRLAIEENTRLGAALLLKMHQDDTEDTTMAPPYGGFANDPFEG